MGAGEKSEGLGGGLVGGPKTGVYNREGSKKTTLRVIELNMAPTLPTFDATVRPWFHLGSVEVEEYEVWEADSPGP